MAGRGTDIKLATGVGALGGLHVLATERHESGRVDRQLFGRAGRQGDPGSEQAFISTEDELIQRYLPLAGREALRLATQARFRGWPRSGTEHIRTGASESPKLRGPAAPRSAAPDTLLSASLSLQGRMELGRR